MACVTKTESFQMIGVEFPRSGKAVRQRTFSLVLHRSGRSFSWAIPVPSGPRQAGQFAEAHRQDSSKAAKVFITQWTAGQELEFELVRFSLPAWLSSHFAIL
jgi:hypothetical protein